jgi:hypothetical protein
MADVQERRYQVFISSTFRDLLEERRKVLEAVLELKAFPSGMEMFPSADDEQWEFIKREIDSSDYYVLVVAGKYGSLAPEGVSYTEKEYDYALAAGTPVLTFLCQDLGELKGALLEEDSSRRELLAAFRARGSANKLVRFYKNHDELKSQVLQALMHAFNFRPQEGWVRARHSRRLEDLEQITKLQDRVRALEAENAQLRRQPDPTDLLAQREDIIQRKFPLSRTSAGTDPPASEFAISATWDEILTTCFPGGLPLNGSVSVNGKLLEVLAVRLWRQYGDDANIWLNEADGKCFGEQEFWQWTNAVRVQLQGLDLIDVAHSSVRGIGETWTLTSNGKTRCALVAGQRRPRPTE